MRRFIFFPEINNKSNMNESFSQLLGNIMEDTDENANIMNQIESCLGEYVQMKILDTFIISTLSKRVHPITLGSIKMGSNPKYLMYMRKNRNILTKAKNEAYLQYCLRMYDHALVGKTLVVLQKIIEDRFGFVPDKKFCLDALRAYRYGVPS